MALAVSLAGLSAAVRAVAARAAVPEVTPTVAVVLAGALAIGVLAGVARRRWEALWPAAVLLPILFLALQLPERAPFDVVERQLRVSGITLLGGATLDAAAVWVWLGGGRGRGANLAAFAGLFGLRSQLVYLGMQFFVPGLLFAALAALLPVAATRHRAGWGRAALRGLGSAAWGVALLASAASAAAWALCVGALTAGDPERLVSVLLDPLALPAWSEGIADSASAIVFGAGLA